MKIKLNDIFNLSGSVIYNPDSFKPISKVSIDSRTIKKNSLYIAIKGNKFDGHDFIRAAVSNGASAVVLNKRRYKDFQDMDCTLITVPNTTKAYGELASCFRKMFAGKVITITGSNGKTTTKEILKTILSEKYITQKTEANNNNHIGVPKTIFDTKGKTEILVLEHGTNHFGEIEYTAKIAKPDISIITNIGDSHLEYLINRVGVYKEKSSLFSETINNGGTIFVNTDDPILKVETLKVKDKITYGFKGTPNVKGKILGYTIDGRTKLKVSYINKEFSIELPIWGLSNAQNVLAAVSIALYLGLSVGKIKSGIKKLQQVKGRLYVEKNESKILIDDTYNSNPASMEAAIDLIKNIKSFKTKSLILGDMFELGENSKEIHENIAKYITKSKISNVFTLGKMMKHLSTILEDSRVNTTHFRTRKSLNNFIAKYNFDEHVILVKGSRGMKMEEFANQIREKGK